MSASTQGCMPIGSTLTTAIKLVNAPAWVDQLKFAKGRPFLSEHSKAAISALHDVNPSANGEFMDYLVRYIIAHIRVRMFTDKRFNKMYCFGDMTEEDALESIDSIMSYESDQKQWTKLCIERHVYSRVFDQFYDPADILTEILIASRAHDLAFHRSPFDLSLIFRMEEVLSTYLRDYRESVIPDICLFISQFSPSIPIELNPDLSRRCNRFAADADIIIGDTLIDIKAAKYPQWCSIRRQLCGYACLSNVDPNKPETRDIIRNVALLNVFSGTYHVASIDDISRGDQAQYVIALLKTQRT